MRQIGAFEAKNTFGTLLDLVEAGEEVVITRRGKRVAKLVKDVPSHDVEAARAAADEIRKMSQGITLGDISVRELIDDGRK